MSKLIIEGDHTLNGAVPVHGAKNSVLPILAATILTGGVCELSNCPRLSDVDATMAILRHLGCTAAQEGDQLTIDTAGLCRGDIPDEQMRELRSSIVFLGALAAKTGAARVSYPGGCDLGARPIDIHLSALRQLGLSIAEQAGQLICKVERPLKGACISLEFPSVGATENLILAAVLAEGTTTVFNAAREPEIGDLCAFLNACGAHISGSGDGTLVIEGVKALHGCRYTIQPDRIVAATYMAAAAVTGGTVLLRQVVPAHLSAVIPVFEETGCQLTAWEDELLINAPSRLRRMSSVRTMPYPGFPTDAQPLLMAMACVANGTSVFIENIFDGRYKHTGELMRMGARIKVEGRVAVVEGVPSLSGARVSCTDLRGGAALMVAGLSAQGETVLTALEHLDRGYETPERYLQSLGAVIRRV